MCFEIPSVGYYTDNGGEFWNMNMDELITRCGVTVKYGLACSLSSNGNNERNHASCDITIKKLIEEKKVMLNDSLVKAASWTHNTKM